jgi:DNA repair exonuclease SbcCD ATPase subunit
MPQNNSIETSKSFKSDTETCYQSMASKMATADYRFNLAASALESESEELQKAEHVHLTAVEAQKVLQGVAREIQQKAHDRISKVVTRCLSFVFDDPYTFRIVFEEKRGKTEARFVFEKDGQTYDPLSSIGGGVVDVASFALRLACVVLSQPPGRPFLVLDEPFKFVSAEHRPRIRKMVEVMAEEMHVQFLIVTHIQELETGVVIRID